MGTGLILDDPSCQRHLDIPCLVGDVEELGPGEHDPHTHPPVASCHDSEDGILCMLKPPDVDHVPAGKFYSPVEAAEDKGIRCFLELLLREKVPDP